jgi:hypothetical protein
MVIQAGDLAVEIDTGTNIPGTLQRHEDGEWRDYVRDGKPGRWPLKLEQLEPGRYRLNKRP